MYLKDPLSPITDLKNLCIANFSNTELLCSHGGLHQQYHEEPKAFHRPQTRLPKLHSTTELRQFKKTKKYTSDHSRLYTLMPRASQKRPEQEQTNIKLTPQLKPRNTTQLIPDTCQNQHNKLKEDSSTTTISAQYHTNEALQTAQINRNNLNGAQSRTNAQLITSSKQNDKGKTPQPGNKEVVQIVPLTKTHMQSQFKSKVFHHDFKYSCSNFKYSDFNFKNSRLHLKLHAKDTSASQMHQTDIADR